MIGVVVSSINCCSYCLTTHGDALRPYQDPCWWISFATTSAPPRIC
ncbi:MAG: hypothetical protein ACLTYN_04630 [Dysosmobacter welbionis]